MRKLQVLFAALLLTGAATSVQAQQPQGQAQRGGGRNMMVMLMEGITLTADQQVKVDSITKKYADQREAMRADQSMDRDARMTKMREMMGKQQEELKAILTDDQKKVFEKNVTDMQARMSQGGGRPPRR